MTIMERKKIKFRWLFFSISGMMLLGLGLSLLGEAIIFKSQKDFNWFYWGTGALATFNAGIGLIGEAIVMKIKLEG
jgi:hypothetical protein